MMRGNLGIQPSTAGTRSGGQPIISGAHELQKLLTTPVMPPAAATGAAMGNSFNIHSYADGGLVTPQGPQQPQAGVTQEAAPVSAEELQGQIQQFMQSNPEAVQKVQEALMEALNSGAITREDLNMAVQMALAAAQNPAMYPRLRQMAIQKGFASEQELPPEYDQGLVFTLLLAGAALQQSGPAAGSPQASAGLNQPPQPEPVQAGQAPLNMANGGYVEPRAAHGRRDMISANLSEGEFVVPEHVVVKKGTDFFEKLIADPKDKGTAKA